MNATALLLLAPLAVGHPPTNCAPCAAGPAFPAMDAPPAGMMPPVMAPGTPGLLPKQPAPVPAPTAPVPPKKGSSPVSTTIPTVSTVSTVPTIK